MTNRQLQQSSKTFLGRHWTEHSVLRRYFPSDADLSILSFGCSTGEELMTLGALFPRARRYGCDLDWHNLQAARALTGDAARVFESTGDEIARHGPYDIILCNSVLLRPTIVDGGKARGLDARLWLDAVEQLHAALKPGGVLQLINSNFPFRLHPVAASYRPLRSPLILGPHFVDQFDLDGRHLCTGIKDMGWSSMLNRYLGEEAWQAMRPEDLHDVHFQKAGGTRELTPVADECIPNCPRDGDGLAFGTTTYRPHLYADPRPSTYLEVDVTWRALGTEVVRLDRVARRIWFDGTEALSLPSSSHLTGASAAAFLESVTGRRSTRLAMEGVFDAHPIRSDSF